MRNAGSLEDDEQNGNCEEEEDDEEDEDEAGEGDASPARLARPGLKSDDDDLALTRLAGVMVGVLLLMAPVPSVPSSSKYPLN